jgi:hypothetical protein
MQLGKLDVPQSRQRLSCKTGDNRPQGDQWLTSEKQNPELLDPIVRRDHRFYQIGIGGSRKRPFGRGRLFCLRCKELRRPAFDEVEFWPAALGSLRGGLCLICIWVMHRRTSVARFATAAADLRVSFPHGDPGEPPTFESREFASAIAVPDGSGPFPTRAFAEAVAKQ